LIRCFGGSTLELDALPDRIGWPDLGWRYSQWLGREKIFFNADSVMSFAMARLKGDQFERSGFSFTAPSLAPGVYDILVYPWEHRSGQFHEAKSVRVRVR